MKLIVGLGNPGPKYAGTRHNVGFDVIDYLAAGPGVGAGREKFEALISEMKEGAETVLLVKPLTFMNLSGRAVRAILDFYKIPVEHVLVICDDLNLPLGKLRMRAKGSHGGQNGLRNIQEQLGTDAYCRLRLGLGQPAVGDTVDFVLGKFKPGERAAAEEAIATAAQASLVWVRQGAEACMNRFNGGDEKEKPKKEKKQKTEDRGQGGAKGPEAFDKRSKADDNKPAGS